MFTPGLDPMMEYKQRHRELLKEAAQYRLVNEALKVGMPKTRSASKILALIGKELANLGVRLEERYGVQPETGVALNRPGSPGGC